MIIYFEGPDGSGKSTLLTQLATELRYSYKVDDVANEMIPTHPKLDNRITEKNLYKQLKSMANDNIIHLLDRGPISDFIYRIFDDYKTVTTIEKFIDFLNKYDDRIICVYCNSDAAFTNMVARGDDNPVAWKKHKELSKTYDLIMSYVKSSLGFNFVKYDYTSKKKDINEIWARILYFCHMGISKNKNKSKGDN